MDTPNYGICIHCHKETATVWNGFDGKEDYGFCQRCCDAIDREDKSRFDVALLDRSDAGRLSISK